MEASTQSPAKSMEIEVAAKHLQICLSKSMYKCVSDVSQVAVAFSGGLDSGTLAFLAKELGVKTHLITVGLSNAPETSFAENAAHAFNLPIHVATYSIENVEEALPQVMYLIKDPNPISVGIAIPLFWTAQVAATKGLKVLLAGQGADELFGGYHRYLGIYAEKGEEGLRQALSHDFATYCKTGSQRDSSICAFHNVELRRPYMDSHVADFALSLAVTLKISSSSDKLRKRVLRKAAKQAGVPGFIANRAKKAVQYSTGVDKALRRLAKRENLSISDYCTKIFMQTVTDVRQNDQNSHRLHPKIPGS